MGLGVPGRDAVRAGAAAVVRGVGVAGRLGVAARGPSHDARRLGPRDGVVVRRRCGDVPDAFQLTARWANYVLAPIVLVLAFEPARDLVARWRRGGDLAQDRQTPVGDAS